MVEPEIPEAVKLLPVQVVALVELQVKVEDCPGEIDAGLAVSEAVTVGGGVVNEPAVHGVRVPAPQQVLNVSPLTGADGFEVWPQLPIMIKPLAESDRLGLAPLAATGSKVTCW